MFDNYDCIPNKLIGQGPIVLIAYRVAIWEGKIETLTLPKPMFQLPTNHHKERGATIETGSHSTIKDENVCVALLRPTTDNANNK